MADYERSIAKEWSQAGALVEPYRPRTRLFPRVPLPYVPDSEARSSWRRHDAPAERITLPDDFIPSDSRKNQNGSRSRSRGDSPLELSPEIGEIMIATHTQIDIAPQPKGRTRVYDALIWGTKDEAKAARTKIEQWIRSYIPEKRDTGWAKVPSIEPEQRARFDAKLQAKEEREKYRRDPPADAVFAAIARFDWPSADYTPVSDVTSALGRNLEACDPIRIDQRCYVKLAAGNGSQIQVMGDDPKSVKEACARLRGTYFQTVSRYRCSETRARLLLCGSYDVPLATETTLDGCFPQNQRGLSKQGGEPFGRKPRLVDFKFDPSRARISARDVEEVEKAIRRTIPTLQYYKGSLQMHARLGTFIMRKYRGDVNTLEDLIARMDDENTEADVYDNEIKVKMEDLQERLTNDPRMNLPGDASHERPEQLTIRPVMSTAFLLKSFRGETATWFKLDVRYVYDEHEQANCTMRAWSQLGAEGAFRGKLLDLCLIDLDEGATAWNLEIKAFDNVGDRNPVLQAFADSVKLDPDLITHKKKPFMKYTAQRGLLLEALVQKKSYEVEYGHTNYRCSLTKRKTYDLLNPNSAAPDQYALNAHADQLEISITSPTWDVALANNGILGMGQKVTSKLDIDSLFPESTGGVKGFLEVLSDIWSILLDR